MKVMETLQDLIEEAKLRTMWWALCIFVISYFLTHTSKSMWMNLPVAILLISGTRILLNEVEFQWKIRKTRRLTYLSHLEKKQLSGNDSRLSTSHPPPKWKRKIESPAVKAAMEDFINKLLQDFVVDLWYSDISPDKEAPELMRALIMDVLAEISARVKEINLVELLTREVVDLIGDHLELFRKNQAAIGMDVMVTLSLEERDERLKHHLMASKELHPALISPECEYKFLKRIMGAVLAVVLKPREAQCPLVRCIARELLTSLVMEPLMRFASPAYINELIEVIFLATTDEGAKEAGEDNSSNIKGHNENQASATKSVKSPEPASMKSGSPYSKKIQDEPNYSRPADWARVLDAATQRRTEVLQPENLDNMWTKGRNYKKRAQKNPAPGLQPPIKKGSGINIDIDTKHFDAGISSDISKMSTFNELDEQSSLVASGSRTRLKRSNNTSDLNIGTPIETTFQSQVSGSIISEFYNVNAERHSDVRNVDVDSSKILRVKENVPKLRCRVLGAYFEKLGSNSFAVYSIAVTNADNKTWFVKRRYRNFEKLHRNLKDIPNYTLHLPPKRIFSSSTEDAFVHQRCIQLDKYLQDLLSIANVAEQHEVWDFLSSSSKNYSFGKSSLVMRTLTVNVDDAVDDIVRQFKGVSDGLKRKVVDTSSPYESINNVSRQITSESANSFSDNEDMESSGWHSDNELNSKGFPPRVVKLDESQSHGANVPSTSGHIDDSLGVPVEWTPPNVSVPLINLVDKIFQLNRRGWLRRQVFLISKQILHLMMEDAIDDWLLRQIHWLRRDDVVALGIRWIQDVLWPEGTFFMRLNTKSEMNSSPETSPSSGSKVNKKGSFEEQLEAARRATDVKKIIIDEAPAALVSLVGNKQYKRCAGDVYDFLQSSVCLKQLGYSLLELAIITVFPELQDIISDVHENGQSYPL